MPALGLSSPVQWLPPSGGSSSSHSPAAEGSDAMRSCLFSGFRLQAEVQRQSHPAAEGSDAERDQRWRWSVRRTGADDARKRGRSCVRRHSGRQHDGRVLSLLRRGEHRLQRCRALMTDVHRGDGRRRLRAGVLVATRRRPIVLRRARPVANERPHGWPHHREDEQQSGCAHCRHCSTVRVRRGPGHEIFRKATSCNLNSPVVRHTRKVGGQHGT
jgi:hypothetical protein